MFQELHQVIVCIMWIMSISAFCLQGSGILMQIQLLNFSPTIFLEIIQQSEQWVRCVFCSLFFCLHAVAVIKMTIIWTFACMSDCCLTRGITVYLHNTVSKYYFSSAVLFTSVDKCEKVNERKFNTLDGV